MNNRIQTFVVTVLACSVVGCAPTTPRPVEEDPELTCGNRTVTVFQAKGFLAVYPEYIDVCSGYNVTISAVPRVADSSLRTAPEEGNPGESNWLNGKPMRDGKVLISVPSGIPTGVYKYSVTVDGVGMLDPHFRVVR